MSAAARSLGQRRLQAPAGTFDSIAPRHAFCDALVAQLEGSPDVRSAAATQLIPLVPRNWGRVIAPEGASLDIHDMASVLYNVVSPRYFEALGRSCARRGPTPPDDEDLVATANVKVRMRHSFELSSAAAIVRWIQPRYLDTRT